MNNLENFCKYFNKIIEEAVIHGGDSGGAYFVNQEKLEESINTFLNEIGLDEKLMIYKDRIPKVLEKNKIF